MATFKIKRIERKLKSELCKRTDAKYITCQFESDKLVLEYNGTNWACIPKYSKGNSCHMNFVLDNETKYKVKYFATLADAIGKTKREFVNVEVEYEVDINFDDNKIANVGYGFKAHYQDCIAKEPGMPTEKYRMHHAISPCNLDLIHSSGRIFKTGKGIGKGTGIEAGLYHYCDLFENNIKVAEIHWESYYKD